MAVVLEKYLAGDIGFISLEAVVEWISTKDTKVVYIEQLLMFSSSPSISLYLEYSTAL